MHSVMCRSLNATHCLYNELCVRKLRIPLIPGEHTTDERGLKLLGEWNEICLVYVDHAF